MLVFFTWGFYHLPPTTRGDPERATA
jgi:hypothetical protein